MFFSLHVVCFFEVSEMFSHTDPHGKPGMHRSCCRAWGAFAARSERPFSKNKLFVFLWSFAGVVMRMFQSWWVHLQSPFFFAN